jgi:oleandomycin transport system ATP-binding protein
VAILESVTGATPGQDSSRGISVAVNGDEALAETVARLAQAGIAVTELSLSLPSLDEVFFTLTGRSAGQDDDELKEAA